MLGLNSKRTILDAICIQKALLGSVLWFSWALWWGGLSFYALVVVPIGTEVIGSVEQGFITQKVTIWHNWLSIVFVLCLAIEAYTRKIRILWVVVALLTMIDLALFFSHANLTSQMDFTHQSVPSGFYAQHAIYLWITAAEWVLGMAIPLCLMHQHYGNRSH